ncbi:hypothetical protein ACWDSJ_37315 [Nocardia sp. NPDC003482]
MTQNDFAARLRISPFTVSKWERHGTSQVLGLEYATRLDRVLEGLTSEQRLRFHGALDAETPGTTLGSASDGAVEEVDLVALARRGFLLGAGMAAFGSSRRTGPIPTALAEGLRSTAEAYRALYRMAPARELLAAAHSHLQLALSLRPADQPDPVQRHLLTTVGEMAALAGTIHGLDLGDWRTGTPYLALAQRSARDAANLELQAVVAACHAFRAAYDEPHRDLRAALDHAEAARTLAAQGGSPITRGWVAAVASERHADLGEETASMRLLDEARTALQDPPVSGLAYSGIGAFDTAKVTAYEGGNHRRLGNHDKAITILDAALAQLDPALSRHRATALIDRAEAHRDAHRIDSACADARDALALVESTQHAGTLHRAMTVARSIRDTGTREATDLWNTVLAAKATLTTPR